MPLMEMRRVTLILIRMNNNIISAVDKHRGDISRAALLAFIATETGGEGFDSRTGKLMIQFEPAWFAKLAAKSRAGEWSMNKVGVQLAEWGAFNSAYTINPTAAMQATSIGLGQIMGFNYGRLGYATVGDMWDDAKTGIDAQVRQIVAFIKSDPKLLAAIKVKDWETVASLYNGAGYKALARRLGRESYDITLARNYTKYSQL